MAQDRDITHLTPAMQLRFGTAMIEYNILTPTIFLVEGMRSLAQQKIYVATGKSKTLKSNHLTGNAVDIGFKGKELYPADEMVRSKLCSVMRKYGLVNGYYDLLRGFDKPHFQLIEMQKPTKPSKTYDIALKWKEGLSKEMNDNSVSWLKETDLVKKGKLHDRNEFLRKLLA